MSLLGTQVYANSSTPLWEKAGSQGGILPAGMVMGWATATPPLGWLICNGATVSRTTYAELFAVIGTTYGAGDGMTTFVIPNLAGKVMRGSALVSYPLGASGGADSITLNSNQIPVHTHPVSITDPGHSHDVVLSGMYNDGDTGSGIVYAGQGLAGTAGPRTSDPGAAQTTTTGITASAGNNTTTSSPIDIRDSYQALNYIIKYTSSNL